MQNLFPFFFSILRSFFFDLVSTPFYVSIPYSGHLLYLRVNCNRYSSSSQPDRFGVLKCRDRGAGCLLLTQCVKWEHSSWLTYKNQICAQWPLATLDTRGKMCSATQTTVCQFGSRRDQSMSSFCSDFMSNRWNAKLCIFWHFDVCGDWRSLQKLSFAHGNVGRWCFHF